MDAQPETTTPSEAKKSINYRIERGEHHLTLNKLEIVMGKLKIRLSDIFPEEF